MKLLDLEPQWLVPGKVFIFRSPSGKGDWILCKNIPMTIHEQINLVANFTGDGDAFAYRDRPCVPMREGTCWTFDNADSFETISVTPSIDASASGNWHGFIKNGAIQ